MTAQIQHGTTTGYRNGCRCGPCRTAHTDETRARRDAARFGPGAPMGPEVRERILTSLRAGVSVLDAARATGVTYQRVYAAMDALPEFREAVDELTAR